MAIHACRFTKLQVKIITDVIVKNAEMHFFQSIVLNYWYESKLMLKKVNWKAIFAIQTKLTGLLEIEKPHFNGEYYLQAISDVHKP